MIAATLDIPADHVIDAAGCYLLRVGWTHTHLGFNLGRPHMDDYASGTVAAHSAVPRPWSTSPSSDVASICVLPSTTGWRRRGQGASNYAAHRDHELAAITEQIDELSRRRHSIKMFMAYPGELMVDDAPCSRCLNGPVRSARCAVFTRERTVIDVLVRRPG